MKPETVTDRALIAGSVGILAGIVLGFALTRAEPTNCVEPVERARAQSIGVAVAMCREACQEAAALECGMLAARLDEGVDACAPLWAVAMWPETGRTEGRR